MGFCNRAYINQHEFWQQSQKKMSNRRNDSHSDLPEKEQLKNTNLARRRMKNNAVPSQTLLHSRLLKRIQIVALFAASVLAGLTRRLSVLSKRTKRSMTIVALVATTVLAGHAVEAQVVDPGPSQPLASLKTVSVPEPDNLGDFVKDKVAAIALGKTLFWDMQVGSDGIQSCASCHFHAGADNRSKNQVNPGGRAGDTIFNIGGGPNYTLKPGDYPFHKLADPGNRSSVVSDRNDITGSQGVFKADFNDIVINSDKDNVTPKTDEIFNVNNINVRQVTDRNTPSAINAVFNFRNFWDGRAQNIFNGVNPFGLRDPNAFVLKANGLNRLRQVKIQLKNSSLASQAVGPPTSSVEQSGGGRQLRPLSIPTTLDSGFPADQIGSNVVAAANNTANRANTALAG